MRIVIIIPTYNESDNIGLLIEALERQFDSMTHKMHILVVDDVEKNARLLADVLAVLVPVGMEGSISTVPLGYKAAWPKSVSEDGTLRPLMETVALHAESLSLPHPVTNEQIIITAPWPKDLEVAVKYLRRFAT